MTIQKRGNSFFISVYCGLDCNKKPIRQTTTFKPERNMTERQAQKAAYKFGLEFENKIKNGINVKFEKLTFNQFCEMYFSNHALTLKSYTLNQYTQIAEKRLKPYFGKMKMVNISSLDVIQWLASLEKDKASNKPGVELSENSKGVYFRTLSAMLGVAVKWNIINDNPCRRVSAPHKQADVKALQQKDVVTLFSKIDSYSDPRAVIIVYILLLTGIRVSELVGLRWSDIDFKRKTLHISREVIHIPHKGVQISNPKSINSNRYISIPNMLCKKLKSYKEQHDKEIFEHNELKNLSEYIVSQSNGEPIHISTIRKWLKKAFKHCGIPYVTIHGLRHTYASLLIANGIDARTTAAQLGHNTPSLVMNVYANPQNTAKQNAAKTIESIAKQTNKQVKS